MLIIIDTYPAADSTGRVLTLIVNPDTESAWNFPLGHTVTVGRGADNDFVLDHPSVSTRHCQITVRDAIVAIKDLGSSNGTFVDDQPVIEARLLPGAKFRVGDVQLQLQDTTPVVAATPPPLVQTIQAGQPNSVCRFHPHNPARFFCPKCHASFCEICVNTRQVEGASKWFCRKCAVECIPVEISQPDVAEVSFVSQIPAAFTYPFRGDGIVLICAGTILLLVVDGARWISSYALFYGLIAVILLTIFGTGYLTAFLRRVITATAQGDDLMPEWPEIDEFSSDVLAPFLQFIGTVAFCFAPVIGLTIYAMAGSDGDSVWLGWATTAAMVFGCIYFPMAFTAVAMVDSIAAVNPLVVIPSILRMPGQYALTVVVLAVVLLVRWLLYRLLEWAIPLPLLPTIITSLIGLYLLVVEMRILGLLYRNNKDRLGWSVS